MSKETSENIFTQPHLGFCPHAAERLNILLEGLERVISGIRDIIRVLLAEEHKVSCKEASIRCGANQSDSIYTMGVDGMTEKISADVTRGVDDLNKVSSDMVNITLPRLGRIKMSADRGNFGTSKSVSMYVVADSELNLGDKDEHVSSSHEFRLTNRKGNLENASDPRAFYQFIKNMLPESLTEEAKIIISSIRSKMGVISQQGHSKQPEQLLLFKPEDLRFHKL